ncbi:hypothetical protein B0H14DRAFT_3784357 [Mycena olivaceomarginata]|nr:hypothetical protein B0H14DRAFT_3784357 [Mycena olivaceomarginata]
MKYIKLRYKDGRLIRDVYARRSSKWHIHIRVVLFILPLLLCNTGMAEGGDEAPMLQHILASDASRTSSARRRGVERIAIGGLPAVNARPRMDRGSCVATLRTLYCLQASAAVGASRMIEWDQGERKVVRDMGKTRQPSQCDAEASGCMRGRKAGQGMGVGVVGAAHGMEMRIVPDARQRGVERRWDGGGAARAVATKGGVADGRQEPVYIRRGRES